MVPTNTSVEIPEREIAFARRVAQLGLWTSLISAIILAIVLAENVALLLLHQRLEQWLLDFAQTGPGAATILGFLSTGASFYGYWRLIRRRERFVVREQAKGIAIDQALNMPGNLQNVPADLARRSGCSSLFSGGVLATAVLVTSATLAGVLGHEPSIPGYLSSLNQVALSTATAAPSAITVAGDGSLWMGEWMIGTPAIKGVVGHLASNGMYTEFSVPDTVAALSSLVEGSDGNIWFTARGDHAFGKITPDGTITLFPLPADMYLVAVIAPGADGNLWIADDTFDIIARVTLSGTVIEYAVPTRSTISHMVPGPDGNLWFTETTGGRVGKITPAGTITEYPLSGTFTEPSGITVGPDGNLWIATGNGIVSITPAGAMITYPLTSAQGAISAQELAVGKDHQLWFVGADGYGSFSLSGHVTSFMPSTDLILPKIVRANDGSLWISSFKTKTLLHLTFHQ